ncbi:hydrolase [Tremella mesenterica]|uniref:Hydrolase n=1 Tax=Tremella mesenterica TaxID=5217 RepID=A0A4Q1B8L5_TREME|nr:uncharacterized protein TREMEDRAFT_33604 [Tremella mesenterica DSM 1558]EIW67451.1 hypothetical protein TREMEDRAFT_33604 [Tremella mesenterica DSM 1558]RXK34992.1 hydrolase [Tremella mesenterica]
MQRKIIIDTDPGVDDVLAILLALASPEIDVTLISIVFGNTHAPVAHRNLLKIYHMLAEEIMAMPAAASRYHRLKEQGGRGKTRLVMGEDGPIGGDKAVAAYFHGPDGLSNISLTHPHFTPPELTKGDIHAHLQIDPRPAHQVILETLQTEPEGTVTIVALGPLTNLAHALAQSPDIFRRVGSVVWMGGALDHPGNTSPVAEFNCFADPYAATRLLDACRDGLFQLYMAPLDVTTPHQIPFSDLIHPAFLPSQGHTSAGDTARHMQLTPIREFVSAMLLRVRGLQASFGLQDALEMHDPVAVWFALAQAGVEQGGVERYGHVLPNGWQAQGRTFTIERVGEYTRGMCVVDRRGSGEEGQKRTENEDWQVTQAAKGVVPSLEGGKEEGQPGDEEIKPKALPMVITRTPGSEELRRLILSRVFGEDY